MTLNDNILKTEEKIMYSLRSLYHESGYMPFKMSRFEEYDMYVKNRNFVGSENIVSFTDLSGRLLALKPDVTLSIIKNYKGAKGAVSKVYYNENVYRPDKTTHEIKEIMQSGIECMGEISEIDECEVVALAIKSLETLSENYILDISSVGIIKGLLGAAGVNDETEKKILSLFGDKNSFALRALCEENGVGSAICDIAVSLCELSGKATDVISKLEKLCVNREMIDSAAELKRLVENLSLCDMADNIFIDFSIIGDTKYYNGIVFRGYVDKLPKSVLSGGRYDNLLKGMGKNGGAIGFAVYSDMLERIDTTNKQYDCDVLLTYEDGVSYDLIKKAADSLKNNGESVNIQKRDTDIIRYKRLCRVLKGGEIVNG